MFKKYISNLFLKVPSKKCQRRQVSLTHHRQNQSGIYCSDSTEFQKNIDNSFEDCVKNEKQESITIISLNRPNNRNAINQKMAKQLCESIERFENDDTSLVAVLHGIGGSFSSGLDMNEISEKINPETFANVDDTVGLTRRIIKKPIVCGISGFCLANGLSLALMCDLRVIEEDATLAFSNRRFGIPLTDGCASRLSSLIGLSRALDLILTGRPITAKEAFEMGLANRLVAPGTSLGQAVNLANCIAKFPQASLTHDRNAVYLSTFEMQSSNKSHQNETINFSKNVINEINDGVHLFRKGIVREGTNHNVKQKSMADWERHEYEIELKLKEDK